MPKIISIVLRGFAPDPTYFLLLVQKKVCKEKDRPGNASARIEILVRPVRRWRTFPALGPHEFLSPTPARCPDRPPHIEQARRFRDFFGNPEQNPSLFPDLSSLSAGRFVSLQMYYGAAYTQEVFFHTQ